MKPGSDVVESAAPASATSIGFRWTGYLLLAYLGGITMIGKGPTYLSIGPLYWGELVMVLGICFVALRRRDDSLGGRVPPWLSYLVGVWLVLGALRTAFSFHAWPFMEVVRDAAAWYYALFFFIGLGLSGQAQWANRTWRILQIFWLGALAWGAVYWLSGETIQEYGPIIPSRGVSILYNARDEIAQNAAFGSVLVFCPILLQRYRKLRWALIPLAIVTFVCFIGSNGRAVKIGFACGALLAASLVATRVGRSNMSKFFALAVPCILAAVLMIFSFSPVLTEKLQLDRFSEDNSSGSSTTEWRAVWWDNLYHAVMQTNPVFGIGFGESLHRYHPLLMNDEGEWVVRSPHNFNMTVFTRMGFVGVLVWASIILGALGSLYLKLRHGGSANAQYSKERREELTFWLLMITCTWINSSMGVLMEGPALGIWFWFALGFSRGRSFSASAAVPSRIGQIRALFRSKLSAEQALELTSGAAR